MTYNDSPPVRRGGCGIKKISAKLQLRCERPPRPLRGHPSSRGREYHSHADSSISAYQPAAPAVLGSTDDKPTGGGVMTRRVLVCSLVLGVMTTVAAYSQAPGAANRAAIEKQIVANERAINDAVAKGDMKTFHSIVAADAAGVDTGGITRVN